MVRLNLRSFCAAGPILLLTSLGSPGLMRAQVISFAGAQITAATGLNSPRGVAADRVGNLFVADTDNNRVVKFPVGGASQTTVGIALSAPQAVAADAAGDLFIADTGNKRVVEIPAGNRAQTNLETGLTDPVGVAIDASGNVYIADHGNGLIEIPSGGKPEVLFAYNEEFINSVAVDGKGNVFLSSTETYSGISYAPGGSAEEIPAGCSSRACVTTVSSYPDIDGVAVNGSDDVYVAEVGEGVHEFSDGHDLGIVGSGIGVPAAVGVDPIGDLFIADSAKNDVVKVGKVSVNFGNLALGASGETLTLNYNVIAGGSPKLNVFTLGAPTDEFKLAGGSTCAGFVTSGSKCVVNVTFTPLAAGARRGAVQFTNIEGIIATTLLYGTALGPQIAYGPGVQTTIGSTLSLNEPNGVAVDGLGDVLIADTLNKRVVDLPPNGVPTTVGADLNAPVGVAVDGVGDVFIVDNGNNQVVKVPTDGAAQVTFASGFSDPMGVALDGAGDVFVADTGNNRVVEIVAGGAKITLDVSVDGKGLSAPESVAVNAEGDVLIADTGNNRVVEVEPNGFQTTVGNGFIQPTGVAVDGAGADLASQPGDVFVVDHGNRRVVEVPADNFPQFTIGTGYSGPHGVALDAKGDLFVTDGDRSAYEFQLSTSDPFTFNTPTRVNQLDTKDGPMEETVENIGNDPLIFATTSGANPSYPANFPAYGEGGTCLRGQQMEPGESCLVAAQFKPTSVGANRAMIVLTDNALNAGNATQAIPASGIGLTATQTILFKPAITTYSYSAHSFKLSATATSGLPVSFASTTPAVCAVSGTTATIRSGGICTIQATQPGNADYLAATPVRVSFTITPVGQTIDFTAIKLPVYAASTLKLSATASSHLPVSFASKTPKVCAVSGSTAKLLIGGPCTIVATQAGDSTYTASRAEQNFPVSLASQTIHFAPITTKEYAGSMLKLTATSTSKLPVRYISETLAVCSISIVKGEPFADLLIAGKCTINATQPGNDVYAPAKAVPQSFPVLNQ